VENLSAHLRNARVLEAQQIHRRAIGINKVHHCGKLIVSVKNYQLEFLINVAGYTGKPNVDAAEIYKAESL